MKVICAGKNCKYSSETEDSTHVIFINFPNDDMSKIWAHNCGRTDLLAKSNEELHLNYYVCSHHIADHHYINKTDPIIIDQHAVPTLFGSDNMAKGNVQNMFIRNKQIEAADNVELTDCDIDVEMDQYQDITIRFSNLCRICGGSCLHGIEIFTEKGLELKIKEKMNLHLPINPNMEDLMPQKICTKCYDNLETAHLLVTTSLKTDMRLKKFLNIKDGLSYDNKYDEIIKMCSSELISEMYMNKTIHSMSIELSSSDGQEIIMNQDVPTKLDYLEDIERKKASSPNNIRKEIQSELNRLIESYSDENKEDSSINEIVTNHISNGINDIASFHCKDSFKTREIFENHKILCNEDEIIIEKQKEITSSTSINELSNCKSFQEENYKIPDKLYTTEEDCNTKKNTDNINTAAIVETNKKCGHCQSIYSTKKELLNHIAERHESQLLFACLICDKSYEKWSSLDVHEATHRIDKPYLCDLCGKSFKHSNNLRGHKRTHLDDSRKKRHVCEICGNAFRSRFHLGEHMNQHNGNKPYCCEKCGKAFYKRIQLRQHKLSHGMNKHVCPICGMSFNRKGNMNTHLKRHSNGDGIYTCSICAYKCKSMSQLKLHRKKHTEDSVMVSTAKKYSDQTEWQCKICNQLFTMRSDFLNHERTHKGERSVECDICGKQLASKNSLIYHKKSVHSKERPHMCQYCGEAFVSKEARLIHERIHTGERPYVCKICKMEYKCSSNLNQHMKIHSDVKPHRCMYCGKSFTRKGALVVHVRIHTGEKPFPCETCGRGFSQKNDMLKHTKTHYAKVLRCEKCNEVFARRKDILKHLVMHKQSDLII
ncbi:uncharacterized protein LOC117219093 [Megalopta genalis]|uniref:uncharacterized protein LOC117219093 n=1 Tax=Megalopta genalis TaxID=115081 RepID=UPI003FD5BE95